MKAVLLAFLILTSGAAAAQSPAAPDGSVTVASSVAIPYSSLASPEAKAAVVDRQARAHQGPSAPAGGEPSIAQRRERFDTMMKGVAEHLQSRFPVKIEARQFDGVATEVITPEAGIDPGKKERVLINLHGGGFVVGSRFMARVESIPLAALGHQRVVAVDYRLAPEHHFPAAVEDVVTVYQSLLKEYRPGKIGIFGCSAGGILVAQTLAALQRKGLPTPGAAGIFCAGAIGSAEGDSLFTASLLNGEPVPSGPVRMGAFSPYFEGADLRDPLVSPVFDSDVLARFPPTLLVTGTRDAALSVASYTHSKLVKAGVDADLHVWEGMGHGFFTTDQPIPEAQEAWSVMVRFFDKHLGR